MTGVNNLRQSLNVGSTAAVRFWLALAALLTGAGHLTQSPGWWSHERLLILYEVVPQPMWGWGYIIAGVLGVWRVLDPHPRMVPAFAVNIIMALVWTAGLVARMTTGVGTLLSAYTVVTLMSHWVLLRTAATPRDENQA